MSHPGVWRTPHGQPRKALLCATWRSPSGPGHPSAAIACSVSVARAPTEAIVTHTRAAVRRAAGRAMGGAQELKDVVEGNCLARFSAMSLHLVGRYGGVATLAQPGASWVRNLDVYRRLGDAAAPWRWW